MNITSQTWINQLYHIPKWKKYSQTSEESTLEHILKAVDAKSKYLVDLGAGDGVYLSNTRFFIENGYTGLLLDANNKGNTDVKEHFLTRENILDLFSQYKVPNKFALLSIDLDGNDIYLLEQVLTKYKPTVIIAEMNGKFEPNESCAIEYNPNHTWSDDDYYGFSFAAGLKVAEKFGYTCIYQNDSLNMYFVENSALAESLDISVKEIKVNVPYEKAVYHIPSKKTNWVKY